MVMISPKFYVIYNFSSLFCINSTLSSGMNALAAVTAEDGVKLIWPDLKKETYALVTKLLGV